MNAGYTLVRTSSSIRCAFAGSAATNAAMRSRRGRNASP